MSEVWSLPGYDVQALLGFGATGEVWRARELATGQVVALKRLRAGADRAAVDALRRAVPLLRGLDTPYLVRLREVVDAGPEVVVVLDHAPGGSLAALLARRGSLEPGEVVTVAAPLAQALAAAHSRGLVHADLTPSSVLFTADGMPLLGDLGLARVAGERPATADGASGYVDPAVARGGDPDPAADVWALAALCHHMLAGAAPVVGACAQGLGTEATAATRVPLGVLAPSAPGVLVAAVESALATDPAARPDAAGLSAALWRAHAAAPVRLAGGLPARVPHPAPAAPVGGAATPRRVPPGVLVGVGLAALVALGAAVGWLSGRGGEQPAPALPRVVVAATPAPAPVDWARVLDGLDAARAEAFAAGDVRALGRVYADGSPGRVSDAALLQSLVDQRRTAHGLRHEVRSVEVLAEQASSARLRVVDVLAAYEVRDAAGTLVSRAAARGEQSFLVTLARTRDGWRLVEVRP